jgi:putative Holliday junction resolvase
VTDPLQIIASPMQTVRAHDVMSFLKEYCSQEDTEAFVVGMPLKPDNTETNATRHVEAFVRHLKKQFPEHPVHLQDERYTSRQALGAMIAGGTSKKFRREKGNIDKVSAAIILQSYLEKKQF